MTQHTHRTRIIAALIAVYLAWGSTYLAIKVALEAYPPLFMMGIRFFVVGAGLFVYLRLRGNAAPTAAHWRNAAVIGTLLLLGGSGFVAYAEQWVASGLSALVIATTPLWIVLFAGIWKRWPTRLEWAGLLIGLVGVGILNLEGDLRAHPVGAIALVLAAMSWAFGSAWSRHLDLPKGMMAGAVEMITGGAVVMAVGFLTGERVPPVLNWTSIGAIVYLGIVGSLVGFTAYMYLLGRVRPALATSYAYVNPVIAVLLGMWFLEERVTSTGAVAMAIIILGVVLVALGSRRA